MKLVVKSVKSSGMCLLRSQIEGTEGHFHSALP